MEIQRIKLSAAERNLLFDFMGEDPGPTIDFNWLMPVVEKIEKLGYTVYIFDNHCKIWEQSADPNKDPIAHGWSGNIEDSEKIAGTHQAVVEFINWHNSQK